MIVYILELHWHGEDFERVEGVYSTNKLAELAALGYSKQSYSYRISAMKVDN